MKLWLCYLMIVASLTTCALYIYGWQTMPTDGATWEVVRDTVVVQALQAGTEAERAGIQVGDRILSVGGRRAEVNFLVQSLGRHFSTGTLLDYVIRRGDKELVLPVTLQSVWSTARKAFTLNYVLIVAIIVIGVVVLLRGPGTTDARVFFIFTQSFGVSMNASPLGWTPERYSITLLMLIGIAAQGPALLHFFLLFPRRHAFLERHPSFPKLMYSTIPLVIIVAAVSTFYWMSTFSPSGERLVMTAYAGCSVLVGVTLTTTVALAVRRFLHEKEFIGHNQLHWIMMGMLVGFVPGCIFTLFPGSAWKLIASDRVLFQLILSLSSFIFVVFGSLAIFRYRLWELENLVKRSLLWATLTASFVALYLVSVYLLENLITARSEILRLLSLGLVTLIFIPLREAFQKRIDLIFHREGYDPTKVIESFEFTLAGIHHPNQLAAKIARQIDEVFHFRRFTIFCRDEDSAFRAAATVGSRANPDGDPHVIADLLSTRFTTSPPPTIRELNADEPLMKSLGAELIVPIQMSEEVLGFFACGPKLSERRYSMEDIKVLSVLAKRTASLLKTLPLYLRDQRAREEFTSQLIQSQETERRRIAGELHDGLGQYFVVILNRAKMLLRGSLPNLAGSDVSEIMNAATQGIDDVRRAAFNLSPYHIEQIGLKVSIEAMMKRLLDSSNIEWALVADDFEGRLQKDASIHVYRIVQECLNNVIKHSRATRVGVHLAANTSTASIIVSDNGKGFDNKEISGKNLFLDGFGLRGIAGRVKLLNGTMEVDSAVGRGTTITVVLPQANGSPPRQHRANG